MNNGKAETVENYLAKYRELSDEDLVTELYSEAESSSRACGLEEDKDSSNAIEACSRELLRRMKK